MFAAFEIIFKELKADISRAGVLPVRYYPFEPKSDFTVVYRGYEFDLSRAPSGWLVGIHPRTADLPILRRSEVYSCDPDSAVVEAKDRVDSVLRL